MGKLRPLVVEEFGTVKKVIALRSAKDLKTASVLLKREKARS